MRMSVAPSSEDEVEEELSRRDPVLAVDCSRDHPSRL
jgi:hypothetical protein